MDKILLENLAEEYGDAFYILDTAQFRTNFAELKKRLSIYTITLDRKSVV